MSKLLVKVWALPGFMGQKADFDAIAGCHIVEITTAASMQEWAKKFNAYVAAYGARRNILLGYSQGGRLALHAMHDSPDLWEHGLFISTHPGLSEGHSERLADDEKWALRFENEAWPRLMKDWHAQPVFRSTIMPDRKENTFSRQDLAMQLRNYSLGLQNVSLPANSTWVVGEYDKKFRQLLPQAIVIPKAGHRVIFDNPQAIKNLLWEICNSR